MFQVGDTVRIKNDSIYEGCVVEIARVLDRVIKYKTNIEVEGYSVYGLGATPTTEMSTFWSDQLEAV